MSRQQTQIMSESQVEEWLEKLKACRGISLGLDRMRALLSQLGNPQDKVKFIRVAGTNGKGSVTAALSSILCKCGIKAGRYTSPAVFSTLEQYVVGEKEVSIQLYTEGMTAVREAVCRLEEAGQSESPTVFEVQTAFAFWLFAREGCEIAVLETGLGGDLDATNAAGETICSVLTSISLDHTRILGTSLREIAAHKAGIIRPGVPVVSVRQPEEAQEVIRRCCEELSSPLTSVKKEDVRVVFADRQGLVLYYDEFEQLRIKQRGLFFAESAAIALRAALALNDPRISEEGIRQGLLSFSWPGRFELIATDPDTILDGAHNPGGAGRLKESLVRYYGAEPVSFVAGVLADKDYESMIPLLFGHAAKVYTVTPDSERALPAEALAKAVSARFPLLPVSVEEDVEEAVKKARKAGGPVVICGTLTIAAAAKKALQPLEA